MHSVGSVLSSDEREGFDRDGYLLLESPGFPESLLDSIVAELEGLYERPVQECEAERQAIGEEAFGQKYGEPGAFRKCVNALGAAEGVKYRKGFRPGRIMEAWRLHPNVKTLALWPGILALLEDLYGRKPLPFQTLNFPLGTEQSAHSDRMFFDSMPSGYMCGVWVALEDIDMDNGPLVYYPGSHKLPQYTLEDAGLQGSEYGEKFERYLADVIEREGLEPSYGTMRKGQALIWAANLFHGGAPQRDKTRTRHSQVTHYYFEGCRYWTPMLSDESHTHWRDPEWIS
jgi:ectoine hydroxylase-related dioxygenase (phytanoyl-CoA dioxygenase family)